MVLVATLLLLVLLQLDGASLVMRSSMCASMASWSRNVVPQERQRKPPGSITQVLRACLLVARWRLKRQRYVVL